MADSKSEQRYKVLQKIGKVVEDLSLIALKAYLNTQIGQGMLRKFVNWIAEKLFNEAAKPILEVLLIKVGYVLDVKEGQVLIERLKKAEESGNETDYNSTVDDILS
jgi:hypothetical protein